MSRDVFCIYVIEVDVRSGRDQPTNRLLFDYKKRKKFFNRMFFPYISVLQSSHIYVVFYSHSHQVHFVRFSEALRLQDKKVIFSATLHYILYVSI